MSTTTTKQKFRTLDSALTRIEELETGASDSTKLKAQIASLTAELAARNAEIKALKAAGSSQQTAAPETAGQAAATKPIDAMSLRELADAADEANRRGDTAAANRFYRAYEARKQAGR